MDFSLSPEERQIRDTVRSFVEKEIMPLEPEVLRNEREGRPGLDDGTLRDLRAKARKSGFWGINTPEEYGGAALGPVMSAIIARSCRSRSAAAPTTSSTPAPTSRSAAT
jgi:alkylation response protein AidB-like acyl-CoA dehydrogenase